MSNKLTWMEMIKLVIMFGLPFVIVLKFAFWINPTTVIGKMLTVVGGIFCYVLLAATILYLTSPKEVPDEELMRYYADYLKRIKQL